MSEMANVKSFQGYLNQIFPGGSLFLILSDREFMMEEMNEFFKNNSRTINAARINQSTNTNRIWIFSPQTQVSANGLLVSQEKSNVHWLRRPDTIHKISNLLISESLKCNVTLPLDNGEGLANLFEKMQLFMPDNFVPSVAAMSGFIMGTCYNDLINEWGEIGIPFLYGVADSCKSEALRCAASLFGAETTRMLNSQKTPSYLFDIIKQTTITVIIDDINKKNQDIYGKK